MNQDRIDRYVELFFTRYGQNTTETQEQATMKVNIERMRIAGSSSDAEWEETKRRVRSDHRYGG